MMDSTPLSAVRAVVAGAAGNADAAADVAVTTTNTDTATGDLTIALGPAAVVVDAVDSGGCGGGGGADNSAAAAGELYRRACHVLSRCDLHDPRSTRPGRHLWL